LIGEKKLCVQCKKEMEVVDVKPSNGNEVQVLSCGHLIETPQSVTDAIADLPSASETISNASKQIDSLNDILMLVDKSTMSQEEKEKTKEILAIVDKEKDSKTLSQIKSSLTPLKTWFTIAAPYVNILVNIIFKP
jgi:hypothetical protein